MADKNDHGARIARSEKDIQNLWKAVDDIKKMMVYRLPLWAVFLIASLTGICGWLARCVVYLNK